MPEPNRMNSQEWSAYFARQAEQGEEDEQDPVERTIRLLESGAFSPDDERLARLSDALAHARRS